MNDWLVAILLVPLLVVGVWFLYQVFGSLEEFG